MSPGMDSLLLGEICLLLFIIFLWFLSVYIFIRRYQIVLCGNSREVPFYKSAVLNKTNENLDNNSLVPLTSFVNSKSSDGFSMSTTGSLDKADEFSETLTTFKSDKNQSQNQKNISTSTTVSNETEVHHKPNSFYQLRQLKKSGSQKISSSRRKKFLDNKTHKNSVVSETIGIKKESSFEMTTTTNNSLITSK